MFVKDIMTYGVEVIPSHSKILEAAQKMRELNVGVIPVSEDNHIVGLLTDRDIIIRAIAQQMEPSKVEVNECMTKNVYSCNQDMNVEDAAKIMEEKQVRRLLVKNEKGDVTGLISLGDIAVFENRGLSGEILKEVSEPSAPNR